MEPRQEIARKSGASWLIADRKAHGRSQVSNGRKSLPGADGRLRISRRFRDKAGAILADQGGFDQCSESRKQLIRRFSAAAVLAEEMEARLANGEQIDVSEHALLCSTLARLASRIGVERRARDITPSLAQYLDTHVASDEASS